MKGIYKRCSCRDESGRQLGKKCPDLEKRHHGSYTLFMRVDTTDKPRRQFKRSGFATVADATKAHDQIGDLVKLAGTDQVARNKIGDLIFATSKNGGELPDVEQTARRLGLNRDLDSAETFGAAWAAYLRNKQRAKKPSYGETLEQHGRCWLLPVLEDVAIDRINGDLCIEVFNRIDMFNEEWLAAKEEGREPNLPGDRREIAKYTGVATQHRIHATLRGFLNYLWKKQHKITYNPAYAVELEPEDREAPLVWDPDQVARFLNHHADDRLIAMWRIVLLRGLRRGELIGLPDSDVDVDESTLTVNVTLVRAGTRGLVWGAPKSRAGGRVVDLDPGTVDLYRAWRTRRKRDQLAAGSAWQGSPSAFVREDGSPLSPDWVSRRFKEMAREAGLPVIHLHAARHTAASMMFEAGDIDEKIVQETLGHSTIVLTRNTYQHVRRQKHKDAAASVANLLSPRKDDRKSGS